MLENLVSPGIHSTTFFFKCARLFKNSLAQVYFGYIAEHGSDQICDRVIDCENCHFVLT